MRGEKWCSSFGVTTPSKKLDKKMRSLVAALNAVLSQLRVVRGQHGPVMHDISGPNSNFKRLQGAVHEEFVAWSADGETSYIETKNIADCFGLYRTDLKRWQERLATADQHLADYMLRDIVRAANQLVGTIRGLQESVASRRIRVVRHHTDYPEECLKIREALSRMNPNAAKELRGMEVDSRCEWPGLDPVDHHQVDSIAKLPSSTGLRDMELLRQSRTDHGTLDGHCWNIWVRRLDIPRPRD